MAIIAAAHIRGIGNNPPAVRTVSFVACHRRPRLLRNTQDVGDHRYIIIIIVIDHRLVCGLLVPPSRTIIIRPNNVRRVVARKHGI